MSESIETVLARIDERQETMLVELKEVHMEVKETNGRVTDLEKWKIYRDEVAERRIAELVNMLVEVKSLLDWRNKIKGAWVAGVVIWTILNTGLIVLVEYFLRK